MPKFNNCPPEMNDLMESVYNECMAKNSDEKKCSMIAIGAAKKQYIKAGGVWKKLGSRRVK